MPTETTPKKFWNRELSLRPRVRGLIVLVLIIACVLGWIDHRARVQKDAVNAIRKVGGRVQYDWQRTRASTERTQLKPAWVEKTLGEDYLHDVVEVDLLRVPGVTDEILSKVGRLERLESLNLNASKVTDAGLAHLEGLSRLTDLNLADGRKIKGGGLAPIGKLAKLQYLSIGKGNWRDADLAHLSGLTDLLVLNLKFDDSSRVTDAGLEHLRPLHQLQSLQFDGSGVTTKGLISLQEMTYLGKLSLKNARVASLEPLKSMTNLDSLDFTGNPITDEGLEACVALPKLANLVLDGDTLLTDAGLASLDRLTRLRMVDLSNTRVGPAAVAALENRPSRPTVKVTTPPVAASKASTPAASGSTGNPSTR